MDLARLRDAAGYAIAALISGPFTAVFAVISGWWWLLIPVAALCALSLWLGDRQAALRRDRLT